MNSFLLPPDMPMIFLPFDSPIIMSPPFDYSLATMIYPYCGVCRGAGMCISASP
jgi:hypothetical protein